MREIGIPPRFSRDKFVPLQTKQRYSTRDISSEVFLTLFFRGFVPFLSLADFVSRNKNLQVADLQLLKLCFGDLVTATTSNHQQVLTKEAGLSVVLKIPASTIDLSGIAAHRNDKTVRYSVVSINVPEYRFPVLCRAYEVAR